MIGVLALQGAFAKHKHRVEALGQACCEVRTPQDLARCEGLIMPGGESTVMAKLLDFAGLWQPLRDFAQDRPIFGTCAGMILLSRAVIDGSVPSLDLMDFTVSRNAYGRQTESFHARLSVKLEERVDHVDAFFIRAPQLLQWGPEVVILAEWEASPVLVQQGHLLAASFHPELTDDSLIHKYFLSLVSRRSSELSKA